MKHLKTCVTFVSFLMLGVIISCSLMSCGSDNDNRENQAKQIVKSFFEEGYVNHNYDYVMDCVAEQYIDHSPASARSNTDAVGILNIVESQFPDMKIEIIDIFAEGEMVSTRIRFEGTHSSECYGVAPTGKKIKFEALENFRVRDGKIVESWGYWPDNEILHQLTSD